MLALGREIMCNHRPQFGKGPLLPFRWVTYRRPAVPLSQRLGPRRGPGSAPALVAGWIGIVTAAISAVCAVGGGTGRSSSDAYRHPTAYGSTAVNATTVSATTVCATVVNASVADASATTPAATICEGVS